MRGVLIALLALGAHAYAKTPEVIFQEASRSIVVVHGYAEDGSATNQGSGVVAGRESVVTNCHVLDGAKRIVVLYSDSELSAVPGAMDADRDLCGLHVPKLAAPAAKLAPGRLRVGQRVYAIGAPEGLELTISEGLVSSIREFEGSQYIQTSAPISAGSSGGGLFDIEAQLVGITAFFVPEGQNINFALPVSWISDLLTSKTASGVPESRETAATKWRARAEELRAYKNWRGLLALGQQWVRSMPTSIAAWMQLGEAYRAMNRPRRAVTAYQQALRLDAEDFDVWLNLGATYVALHQYDRATEAFQEALRMRPDNLQALAGLGAGYYYLNQQDKVREVHKSLARLDASAAHDFGRKYMKR